MKCYLDSNVLIYFKLHNSPYHKSSMDLLEELTMRNAHLYISSLVMDEVLYFFYKSFNTHKMKVKYEILESILKDIVDIPNLFIVNPSIKKVSQLKVIDYMEDYNLKPRDAFHLLTIKNNKISYFATFDKDFEKVFEKKVIKKFEKM